MNWDDFSKIFSQLQLQHSPLIVSKLNIEFLPNIRLQEYSCSLNNNYRRQ